MDSTVLMPSELTAENGAKCALMGEFEIEVEMSCPRCDEDDWDGGCEVCGGDINYTEKHTIDWRTIKEIYSVIVKQLGIEIGGPGSFPAIGVVGTGSSKSMIGLMAELAGTRPGLIIVDDLCKDNKNVTYEDLARLADLLEPKSPMEFVLPKLSSYNCSIDSGRKEHLKSCQPWKRKKKGNS